MPKISYCLSFGKHAWIGMVNSSHRDPPTDFPGSGRTADLTNPGLSQQECHLDKNKLTFLPETIFSNQTLLEDLNLQNNQLSLGKMSDQSSVRAP